MPTSTVFGQEAILHAQFTATSFDQSGLVPDGVRTGVLSIEPALSVDTGRYTAAGRYVADVLPPSLLGDYFRELRESKSYKPETVAARAGVTAQAVRYLESGVSSPRLSTAAKIYRGMGEEALCVALPGDGASVQQTEGAVGVHLLSRRSYKSCVGVYLQQLRQSRGGTIIDFAEEAQVGSTVMTKYVRGYLTPTPRELNRILSNLGIGLQYCGVRKPLAATPSTAQKP